MKRAIVLFGVIAITACGSRPGDIPAPAPGVLSAFGGDCPDLRGHYDLALPEGRRRGLPGSILAAAVKAPRHHRVVSIESSDASAIRFRSWATDADLRRGFAAWREGEAYRYALWSGPLEAVNVAGGLELRRPAVATPIEAPAELPRSREFEVPGSQYRCTNGWIVLEGEAEPDADHADNAAVSLTRAADGGIVATWRFRRSREFSIWCGDGCKGNLPLPDERVQRWWHAPPTDAVVAAPIDWAAWIADDPRPLVVRNRYAAGRFLPYADAEPGREATPHAQAPSPMLFVGIDRAVTAPAVPATSSPGLPSVDAALEAATVRWREHLTPMLPPAGEVAAIRCEARACFVDGHVAAMADVSTLLRALATDHGATPELLLIERVDEGRYRFELRLPPRP